MAGACKSHKDVSFATILTEGRIFLCNAFVVKTVVFAANHYQKLPRLECWLLATPPDMRDSRSRFAANLSKDVPQPVITATKTGGQRDLSRPAG